MRLTKNDKARVVIQAMHNLDELPKADSIHVKREMRRVSDERYELAHKILTDRAKERGAK